MEQIVNSLLESGIDMSDFHVLDFFAREGDWLTFSYTKHVKKIVAWEIEHKYFENLKINLPNAEITIGNSFDLIKNETRKFNMIVVDNPNGCYGDQNQYCEHFDAINSISKNMKNDCIVFFNVKSKPFNYKDNSRWQERRNQFYGLNDSSDLQLNFFNKFYYDLFEKMGYNVKLSKLIERKQEKNLYLACFVLGK